jgi:hypothetical protein
VCQGVTTEIIGHCGFYADPRQYPSGGRTTVLVNGIVVVEDT